MDLSQIKRVYNSIPRNFLTPLHLLPFSVFCGKQYRNTTERLRRFDSLCYEQQAAIRSKNLIEYLNEAITYTPFYQDVAKKLKVSSITDVEQLNDFPILSKTDIQDQIERFTDLRFKNRRFKVSTGGTTGKQTELYLSNDCYQKEWAFVNQFLSSEGVNENSKRICLRGVNGIPAGELLGYNPLYKEILVSPFKLSKDNIKTQFAKIDSFRPQWIHGYPSSVAEFSRQVSELKLSLKDIKHVLLVSEKIYDNQLEAIALAFDAKVLSFYGMTERLIFAPYKNGSFWPHYMYGVCEEMNDELIGTGFINSATKLIRFRTGDSAEVKKRDGFVHEITSLEGRWGRNYLVGKSGTQITMTALNIHCDALSHVKKYQFRQAKPGSCYLLLVPASGFEVKDQQNIHHAFQQKVGNELIIKCLLVDDIPLTKRGKHEFIVKDF